MTRAFSSASTLSAHLTTSGAPPTSTPRGGYCGDTQVWETWVLMSPRGASEASCTGSQEAQFTAHLKEALGHPPGPWKALLDRHPITTQQRPERQNSDSQHSTGGGSLITVLPCTQDKRLPGQRPTQLFSLTVTFWPPRGAHNHLAATVLTASLCFQ